MNKIKALPVRIVPGDRGLLLTEDGKWFETDKPLLTVQRAMDGTIAVADSGGLLYVEYGGGTIELFDVQMVNPAAIGAELLCKAALPRGYGRKIVEFAGGHIIGVEANADGVTIRTNGNVTYRLHYGKEATVA